MTLDKLPVGQNAVITKVGGEGELRCRILDMGLIPKTKVSVVSKVAPMGDPIEIHMYVITSSLMRKKDAHGALKSEEVEWIDDIRACRKSEFRKNDII